jgi:hypothetical protein
MTTGQMGWQLGSPSYNWRVYRYACFVFYVLCTLPVDGANSLFYNIRTFLAV